MPETNTAYEIINPKKTPVRAEVRPNFKELIKLKKYTSVKASNILDNV